MKFKFRPLQLLPLFIWLLPFFSQSVSAEAEPGIATSYYTIDEIPPIQSDTEYLLCGTEIENNINRNYDYELFGNCTYDLFMIHMTGFIDVPEHNTIEFMLATDDGGTMEIDNYFWGNWNDQGCTWMMSGELTLEPGSNPFEVWMYEHGGNSCMMLAWNINNQGWEIVPEEVFTQQAVVPTTTTSSTTTTSPSTTTSTTTTEVSTTTSSSMTTLPTVTTTTSEVIQSSTTTSAVDTTTTTTTTTLPTTTTTEAPYTPPQTTTTIPTIEIPPVTTITEPETTVVVTETTEPETSTTEPEEIIVPDTTEPETLVTVPATIIVPDTTEPETSTTVPDGLPEDTVEPDKTTIPVIVVPDRVDVIPPGEEIKQPIDISGPQEDTIDTGSEQVKDSSPITLPLISEIESIFNVDISEEELVKVLDEVFADITDTEQVVEVVSALLDKDLDKEELTAVMEAVFSEEASVEQMEAVVNDLLEADLSKEELSAVFDAVFDEDLSDKETIELAQEVLKGELDAEELGTVIDAIFDEVVTDEVLIETFTAVLETELDEEKFETVVNALESETISNEQVAEVVTLIIEQEGGVSAEQATELATSEKVLESIDGEQATEVFDAVVASEVSPEDGLAISEAVQEAPKKVRKAFEKELNVFEGVFDVYVPMGSRVPVGDRRVIVGVGAVLLSVPVRVRVG